LETKSFVLPHAGMTLDNLPSLKDDQEISIDTSKFNLLHAGSLLGPRHPRYLIEAYIRFLEDDEERKKMSVLNIVGKVARELQDFEKEYTQYTENINILTKRVSYKHSHVLLSQADVLILLEAKSEDSPFMPGKLSDYIMANKPILALSPQKSETRRILGQDYPYLTESDDVTQIYKLIVKLWNEWKLGSILNPKHEILKDYISAENINKILMENINVHNS